MRWFRIGSAVVLLVAASGCGQPRSRVYGTVRYQDKPLTAGTIVFLAPDNRAYPVKIRSDGSYQIASLPRGRVRVGIQMPRPRPPARPAPGTDSSKIEEVGPGGRRSPPSTEPGVVLPSRYADPEQSGLDFDLQSPEQEYAIDLK